MIPSPTGRCRSVRPLFRRRGRKLMSTTLSSIRTAVRTVSASSSISNRPSTTWALEVDRPPDCRPRSPGPTCSAGSPVQRLLLWTTADVILRRADVRGSVEGNPRMPGLEQTGEHLPPQLGGGEPPERRDLPFDRRAARSARTVPGTRFRQGRCGSGTSSGLNRVHDAVYCRTRWRNRSRIQFAVCMSCVRRRSSPMFLRRSRNSSTIKGARFQVRTDRPLPFAHLVDRHRGVVDHLERMTPALAVRPVDTGSSWPGCGSSRCRARRPLRELRVVRDDLEDVLQVIVDRRSGTRELAGCGCGVAELNSVGVARWQNRNVERTS